MKKWHGEFSKKLHLLVCVFIVDCDFKHGVDVAHFTGVNTTTIALVNNNFILILFGVFCIWTNKLIN